MKFYVDYLNVIKAVSDEELDIDGLSNLREIDEEDIEAFLLTGRGLILSTVETYDEALDGFKYYNATSIEVVEV